MSLSNVAKCMGFQKHHKAPFCQILSHMLAMTGYNSIKKAKIIHV